MRVTGIDENGLGPRLGPLVATSCELSLPHYASAERWMQEFRELGIDDSKRVSSFANMRFAEATALGLLRCLFGHTPRTSVEVLTLVSAEKPSRLQEKCPLRSKPQCWSHVVPLPAYGGELAAGEALWSALRTKGVRPVVVRCALACPQTLNQQRQEGHNRFTSNLKLFGTLVSAATARRKNHRIVCGMVGGIRDYASRMPELALEPRRRKAKGIRAYRTPGGHQISFEVDADALHPPVSIASIVGKYVRELWMEQQNRFYINGDPLLERVSGYNDPKTSGFIASSVALRHRLQIAESCFLR